jgi:hypothetical protein
MPTGAASDRNRLDLRNSSRTTLLGTICAAVCSNRNLSAHTTIGRNSS